MASYNELNALIDAYINRNGVQAITGQILNGVLKAMVEQLGRGYTIMGAAIPTTDPGTPDGPECYFASETGTYTDFDGLQVAPGELALLCYTPTDGWTKETIYEGFQEVGASIDGNVGTPSVGVSYANGVLSFDFHNMKGNPGQNGQDGDAAGFGTIGADITGGVGTPGVTVESSGPATAKNLQFHFTNLKGETGVTSVVATVDNTTGTPACTVSLVGQQLTLAFSGLKGAQGNTGSSVDYPFTIVNNLTTDDATQALSAAQGVVLAGQVSQLQHEVTADISQLEHEVDDIADKTDIIHRTHTPASVGKNKFDLSACTANVRLIATSGAEYGASGYKASDYMDVGGQTKVTISFTVSISSGFVYCFYDDTKTYVSGTSATWNTKDDATGRYYLVVDVPATAKYMRCSSQLFDARYFQMEFGNQVTAYEAYQYTPASTKTWIEESAMPLVMQSVIGGDLPKGFQTLASNATIELEQDALKSFCLRFYGKFSSFSGILIGHGSSGSHSQYIKVDGTNITFFSGGTQGSSIAHGLTIASYIAVSIDVKSNCDYTIRIETLSGSYKRDMTYPSSWTGNEGKMFVTSVSTAFTLASLTFCGPFQKTKWLYGDSYVSNYSDKRWPYYIQNWGFDNMLINGCPGQASASAYVDWTSCLNHGTPKFAIWAMGMNDPDSGAINASWLSNVQNFLADCENRQIIPILCTIPNVPSYEHTYKNAWIKASGYRYIDFAEAVGAEEAGSTWLTGCLSTDNVHPTADGARLLACRALQDVPELMQE